MQLDQTPRHRQANSQAPRRLFDRTASLGKHIEYARQHLRGDTDAGIFNAHHNAVTFTGRGEPNVSCAFAELCRVVEKVREHLSEPHRVAFNIDGFRR